MRSLSNITNKNMEFASSLYRGGELVAASQGNHNLSRELGLICPFCKESVHYIKEYWRGNIKVAAAWRHYKIGVESNFCESRALSSKGKQELKQLSPTAQKQRLKLFNRRFWEIFSVDKYYPKNFYQICLQIVGSEKLLNGLVDHCLERWDTDKILEVLPESIKNSYGNPDVIKASLERHPAAQGLVTEEIEELVNAFSVTKFTVLRLKILSEVVCWLKTKTAKPSFERLIYISILDCAETLPFPIHTQSISQMALISLTITDWEKSIASLENPTKAIGFGVR